MTLIRRILFLALVSLSGIALLAPLAARSAAPVPVDLAETLLPAPDVAVTLADRGSLSGRGSATEIFPIGETEQLEPSAVPTPASAPMEATLHSVATPRPTPAPVAAAPAPQRVVTHDGDGVWDRLAKCESGGNWAINTGNGYYGGLQFNVGTWQSYGGGDFAAYPHEASRAEQITVAERLRAARGYQPWPACRAKLGLP